MGELVKLDPTAWFPLSDYSPVRDGWYEVQLASGETAFAKFGSDGWTEKPMLVFTHWRGLSGDPSKVDGAESIEAEVTAAEGVRAVWDTFFPGSGAEQHKPLDAGHGKE
jgi:hypothetical protein